MPGLRPPPVETGCLAPNPTQAAASNVSTSREQVNILDLHLADHSITQRLSAWRHRAGLGHPAQSACFADLLPRALNPRTNCVPLVLYHKIRPCQSRPRRGREFSLPGALCYPAAAVCAFAEAVIISRQASTVCGPAVPRSQKASAGCCWSSSLAPTGFPRLSCGLRRQALLPALERYSRMAPRDCPQR